MPVGQRHGVREQARVPVIEQRRGLPQARRAQPRPGPGQPGRLLGHRLLLGRWRRSLRPGRFRPGRLPARRFRPGRFRPGRLRPGRFRPRGFLRWSFLRWSFLRWGFLLWGFLLWGFLPGSPLARSVLPGGFRR